MIQVHSLQSILQDRYRFDRELGRGGMAHVWLALDLRHERPVALKVLRPDIARLDRFEQASTWLDRAVTSGFPCYPWYARDPLLEPFRRDSSGHAFLERLRTRWTAAKVRYD